MIRKEHYPVEQILELIRSPDAHADLDGDTIKVSGVRLNNFAQHGITCVRCGITGTTFIKEKHHASDQVYHLNLYATNAHGHLVLMTKDHIVPRSRGGSEELSNMQPMCTKCNGKKDSRLESELEGVVFVSDGSKPKEPKLRKYHVFGVNGDLVRRLKNYRDLLNYINHVTRHGQTGLSIMNMDTGQTLPMDQVHKIDLPLHVI